MKFWKRILIWKLCFKLMLLSFLTSVQPLAFSQATATSQAAYWNMNRALSGVTQDALKTRGYVANDPRTYATLQSMSSSASAIAGSSAAALVGTVLLAGVTAPAWGTIVLVAAVSSAVGIAVSLGINGLINWATRSDSKIDVTSASQPYSNCSLGSTGAGYEYWDASINGLTVYACDGMNLALQALQSRFPVTQAQSAQTTCGNAVTVIYCTNANGTGYAYRRTGPIYRTCGPGTYLAGTECLPYTYTPPPVVPAATAQSLQQAVTALPETEKVKPLNPQLVATTANTLWQHAATQPGYAGVPYPVSNPISTVEATAWQQANPTAWPTVGDYVTPRPTTTTTPSPWALPLNPLVATPTPVLTNLTNTAVINPSTQPLTNLGPDPVTPPPTLEPTPTAQQILAPILTMVPGLRTFNATGQVGSCPKPSFQVVGKTIQMEAHCTVIDSIKPTLQVAMTFAWAAIALFIILSA
jgi:hypothetical protein